MFIRRLVWLALYCVEQTKKERSDMSVDWSKLHAIKRFCELCRASENIQMHLHEAKEYIDEALRIEQWENEPAKMEID